MNTARKIAKNTVALTAASLVNIVIGFFFTMYVARYLGVQGYGVLSFAIAITSIFAIFTDIGLNKLAIREVARDRFLAGKYLGNLAVLKLILCVASFGLIALTVNLMHYPDQTIYVVYLVALSVVVNAFNSTFYSIFQAHERMEFVSAGQILTAILQLAVAIMAVSKGLSIIVIASSYLLASVITLGYSAVTSILKFSRPSLQIDFSFWKETLKEAWPFGLGMMFASIYYWMSSVMLSWLKGDEVVGLYSAAYKPALLFQFFPVAYSAAVFPVMSKFHSSSGESLRFTFEKSIKFMIIVAVPIGIGMTLLAGKIISLVFGSQFYQSIIALQILSWSAVFIFISLIFAQLFGALGKQATLAKVNGISALVNIGLNLSLIPKFSYVGASVATVVTEFAALAILYVLSFRMGYGISAMTLMATTAKVLFAGIIMGVFVFFLQNVTLWALVPFATMLYFATLYLVRGIDKEDTLLLRQTVAR